MRGSSDRLLSSVGHSSSSSKLKVFPQQPDFSPFSFFSHVPIVVPLWMRWRAHACVGVQACVRVRMRACLSNLIFFFPPPFVCVLCVCVWSEREGMCLFSRLPSSAQPQQGLSGGENKRGRRGGESAPTVDLAIVRSREHYSHWCCGCTV